MATETGWDVAEVPPLPVRRFTVDEYHRMIRSGLFADDERFELLEGWIVPKLPQSPPHCAAIALADEAFRAVLPPVWRIRIRSGTTTADSEPEPDLAVVRGDPRDYLGRHPGPGDAAIVIEVADSSLARDRGLKKRIYARAGYPYYWIVNLAESQVEVHGEPTGPGRSPDYGTRRDYRPGEAVPVVLDGREVGRVAVADLLP